MAILFASAMALPQKDTHAWITVRGKIRFVTKTGAPIKLTYDMLPRLTWRAWDYDEPRCGWAYEQTITYMPQNTRLPTNDQYTSGWTKQSDGYYDGDFVYYNGLNCSYGTSDCNPAERRPHWVQMVNTASSTWVCGEQYFGVYSNDFTQQIFSVPSNQIRKHYLVYAKNQELDVTQNKFIPTFL